MCLQREIIRYGRPDEPPLQVQGGIFVESSHLPPEDQNHRSYRSNPITIREAVIRLLPKDHYSAVLTIGLVSGIGYYICAHDSLLLTTFLSIMFGSTLEKTRSRKL
jgi:hypothetical protein